MLELVKLLHSNSLFKDYYDYTIKISFGLTKTKALFMTSIRKITSNINDLTIHSALNIPVQQSLFNLPNLSLNSLNRLTCQYEQLQLVVIDET